MKLKAVSGVMLTLLVLSMLSLAFDIQPAKGEFEIATRSDVAFVSSSTIIINQTQIWHGDFVVNETDIVIVQNCNFTVKDGDIIVYGDFVVKNSTLTMRRNTLFKDITVYGNLTFLNSTIIGRVVIWSIENSLTEINDSRIYVVCCEFHATVYMDNSSFAQIETNYGKTHITNSTGMQLGVDLRPSSNPSFQTYLSLVNTNLSKFLYLYIDTELPESLRNLRMQPGYIDSWEVADIEWNLNVTISDCFVDKWRVSVDNYRSTRPMQLCLYNSTLDGISLYLENPPERSYDLTLETGFIQFKEVYVDNNFNVTIKNSTINNVSFSIFCDSDSTFRFIDSNFSSIIRGDSNVSIFNSTMTYLLTYLHGNLTLSNVTTNALMLGLESGSMDLILAEGYQDFINFYNEEQGFNITIMNSKVNHWGIETMGNATVNLYNSTITGLHPEPLCSGLIILRNSSVYIYNSNLTAIQCASWSPSLTTFNSTIEILYAFDNSNITAINSTIGILITDPITLTLINSVVLGEVQLSLQLTSDHISSAIMDEAPVALPSNIEPIGKCLNITTTYNDVFSAQIRLYYDEGKIEAFGISEKVLRMYCLKKGSTEWYICPIQGVNIAENYVWANVTHFSYFITGATHDITITNVKPTKTVVGQGYPVSINVTVENQGFDETFNVTVYASTDVIAKLTNITLTSGNDTTIFFTWNTTDFAKGNYTISANATTVSGETDTADNICIDGTVRVNMAGDVAPEYGLVDIVDLVYVAIHFGAAKGQPEYEPIADINDDDIIDIVDIVIVALHFGETDP